MSVSLGIWHITLEGGTEKTIQTPAQIQITNISFGEEILDNNGRSVVKLQLEKISPDSDDEDEDEEEAEPKLDTTILCALTPGKIEQTTVNLVLDLESEYTFSVSGKNTVHLTGNYIRQLDEPPSDDENEFFSDEDNEDGYDLREVSSDVEIYPDDLDSDAETDASRFEEVEEEAPKASKRARESDAAEEAEAPSKKNKKLRAEGGKAVTAPETQVPDKKEKKERKKEKKESKAEGEAKKDDETKDKKKTPKAAGEKKTLSGGVVIQDAKIGTGPMAKKGNRVSMRYIGKLTNGTQFDANTKGTPFSFNLGKGEVIKGWDEGIVGMQVGGERVLTIPPKMGYGSTKQGKIPSNSTLVFDVKLLSIK